MDLAGWTGLALGGASLYNSYSQGKSASKAASSSNALSQQQLDMAQEDRDYYKSIYGDLEKNLSNYYTKLTPSKAEQLGLSRYDTQFKAAKDNYTKSMAQRGLTGSGIEAEGNMAMNMQSAQDRTNIINQADEQTRADQLGFLGVGLGQSNIATQNVNNAYQNSQNSYNNMAKIAQSNANSSAQGLGDLIKGASYAYGRDKDIFKGSIFG